jgi:dTDP-4-amino-4,6-dideoxygalactose transaminase
MRKRFVRHLPPTAVPVRTRDVWQGLQGALAPDRAASAEKLRAAVMARTGSPVCYLALSGRAALTAILTGLKKKSGRRQVIVPAYSCPTVVQSVLAAGLEPVLCDVEPETLDLDRGALLRLAGRQTLAIVAVHLYGWAQDVRDLLALGEAEGIAIVEDAAQAFGARLEGRMVGTWGHAGLYSLGRGKCIPAGGGGIIVARDALPLPAEAIEAALRGPAPARAAGALARFVGYALATRPAGWWFVARSPLNPADDGMDVGDLPPITIAGLPAVQAAIGASLLKRLEPVQETQRQNAQRLRQRLAGLDFVSLPRVTPGAVPVYLRFPLVIDRPERAARLFDRLWQVGIGVSRSYRRTLADLFDLSDRAGSGFAGAARLASCLLTLPTHAYLDQDDFDNIAEAFGAEAKQKNAGHGRKHRG